MATWQRPIGSTNTAMMSDARRLLPPLESNKRKERESIGFSTAEPNILARSGTTPTGSKALEPALSNQLLAGYLAHEFLTKGILFGEPRDRARVEALRVSAAASASTPSELRKMKGSTSSSQKGKAEIEPVEKKQRYVEAANLFKEDGVHLPDIVNPTQLARFLHL